ncbi:MAG: acetyl-CoA carboxylase biotin carboxyl carrier protein [Legionellales bacterium]|nr:acetyl-CoA carboxylase biotin carboxyl carrier protein [Legionellales bacterium]
MDIRDKKPFIKWLVDLGFTDIEFKEGEETLRLSRQSHATHAPAPHHHAPAYVQASAAAPEPQQLPPAAQHEAPTGSHVGAILSPMVGTFYNAPSPDAPTFVKVGQTVKTGDTLCIIEAMKMFNEIEAEKSGTITAVHVLNGAPVEFGQPLFTIE